MSTESSGSKRKNPESGDVVDAKKVKKNRWDSGVPAGAPPTAALSATIQEKLASISAKMKTGNGVGSKMPTLDIRAIAEQAARARELLQKQTQSVQKKQAAWKPLLLDKQGRQIDEEGNVVQMKMDVATLKVNQRQEEELESARGPRRNEAEANKFEDPRLNFKRRERMSKSFAFLKPGKHIAKAQNMRMKQLKREMRTRLHDDEDEDDFGIDISNLIRRKARVEPPATEWWDLPFLDESENYGEGESEETWKVSECTDLIYVPVVLEPVAERSEPPPMSMMLTQKERKKMKRMKAVEKQKEEQDKVRLGLMQAPEPKMRLSSLMRILGNDAILEPSKMEKKVRKQMAARKDKHEAANKAAELTPEQRREKKHKKLSEDVSVEVHVSIYRVGDLSDSKKRFKVDIHAQQYQMTGQAIVYGNCNVIVVEGGPKNMKKYNKLLMNRINWEEEDLSIEDEDDEDEEAAAARAKRLEKVQKKCVLVWKGIVKERAFRTFRFEHCRTEADARQIFEEKNCAHYWDMCRNSKIE